MFIGGVFQEQIRETCEQIQQLLSMTKKLSGPLPTRYAQLTVVKVVTIM